MARSKAKTARFLRYDPEREDYTVTEAELEMLERGNAPLWKDVFLVALPLAISTLINGYAEVSNQPADFKVTKTIFFNFMFGIVGLGFTIIFGIAWWRSKTKFAAIIKRIKAKPRIEVPIEFLAIGALPLPNQEPNDEPLPVLPSPAPEEENHPCDTN